MAYNFEGKRALVTGAGKGIGRYIAKALAEAGAHTIALSRTAADLDSLKIEDSRIETVVCDVSNWDETRKVVEGLGHIHLLVNNAGVFNTQPALESSPEEFDRMFNINVKAVMNITQVVARGMVERGAGGSIVHLSSISARIGFAACMSYGSSKAALDQMMRVMAVEWAPHQVRVNSVMPGLVKTNLTKAILTDIPEMEQTIINQTPMGRLSTEENISNAVMYLLSDKSDMITGTVLPVEGGQLLGGAAVVTVHK